MRLLPHVVVILITLATITPVALAQADAANGQSLDAGDGYRLFIPSWHLRVVAERRELAALCRTGRPIFACTDFVGLRLDCGCRAAGAQWRLEARAQVIPFVYLWDVQQLTHERMHVADVRHDLITYLQRLTVRRFETAAACEAEARDAAASFPRKLNWSLVASNRLRH